MKTIIIILVVLILYIVWQYLELQKFRVKEYTLETDRLQEDLRIAVIADLHCHEYGEENERLLSAIEAASPDVILIPGDMIVSAFTETYDVASRFLSRAVGIAPVYLSNGNHESRVEKIDSPYHEDYHAYRRKLETMGIHILNNQKEVWKHGKNSSVIYGVDIPLACYEKGKKTPLPEGFLHEKLGVCEKSTYTILLAHNPAYCEDYAAWGADLILAGHTHGGLVRIPGIGSVISPQFELFPKYDSGRFDIGKSTAIISRGLGTHTFHIRVFDRAELLVVHIKAV